MILTVGTDEGLREQVARSLRDTQWATTIGTAATVGEAQEILRSTAPPRVVVVGQSIGVEGAAEVAAIAIGLRNPPLVLLVGEPTTELLRSAMRAGIRDVLPVDFSQQDLVATLRDAGVSGGGPDPVPGMTVAVFSTKGGVGTSVLASNLAVLLGNRVEAAATLVDLDLASADQAIMHGLSPQWTIQDLADGAVGLDEESLEQVLIPIEGSNSRLLPGPVDPALAETITPADVGTVVAAVRAQSPIAVLDTSSGFDDRTLAALDAADVTVLAAGLDVAALRSLTVSLQTMERLGIDAASIFVVLVRADSKSGLVVGDVERTIDRPVDVGVPSTRRVPRSVNEGVPLAVSSPRTSVVAAIEELVELLLTRLPEEVDTVTESSSGSGGLFPWTRGSTSDSTARAAEEGSPGDAASPPPPSPQADPPVAEAEGAADTGVEDGTDDNVRPIHSEAEGDVGGPRKRRVRPVRRAPSAGSADGGDVTPPPPPADDDEEQDEDEAGENLFDEPSIRAVPSLDDMPPPVAQTDDDDEPRRRRRR